MARDFHLPGSPESQRRWRAWLTDPGPGVPIRRAATAMIVRDGAAGLEVFMMRRAATMEFAAKMTVFPGGGVDPRDADARMPWAGPTLAAWADTLGTDEATAQSYVAAAVREVFEECGVLLAGPDESTIVGDVSAPAWQTARRRLEARETSLSQVLAEHNLVVRSDLLAHRAHWVTPVFETRRYDTHFFVATLPEGQRPDGHTSEAAAAGWHRPQDVLADGEKGRALLLPPTRVSLEYLATVDRAADVLAATGDVPLLMPSLAEVDGQLVLRVAEL